MSTKYTTLETVGKEKYLACSLT